MNHPLIGKVQARTAAIRYRHPAKDLRVIAVAGAYGKTTTALLLAELLQETGLSVVTMTSQGCMFNGQTFDAHYDNSAAHLQSALAKAKQRKANFVIVELTDKMLTLHSLPTLTVEMAIVTSDDPTTRALLGQSSNYAVVPSGFDIDGLSVAPHQAISFGTDELAEAKIEKIKLLRGGTEVELIIDHQTKLELATYLVGEANVRNVAAAVAGAYVLAADIDTFQDGLARLEKLPGNFEKLPSKKAYTVFVDRATQAASVELAVSSARQLTKRRLLVALDDSVVIGDLHEVKTRTDRLVLVGSSEEAPGVETAANVKEAFEIITRAAKKDDLVLFLGTSFAQPDERGETLVGRLLEGEASE